MRAKRLGGPLHRAVGLLATAALLVPALSSPASSTPAQSIPAQSTPAQSTPAEPVAARPAPAASGPTRIGMAYGNNLARVSEDVLGTVLDDAVALGVDWIRIDLPWTDIQPNGPKRFDWSRHDRVVAAATERGLEVLPILTYSPPWARDLGCPVFTCPPRAAKDFTRFTRKAVKRYAPRGVDTWEVWNEPNLTIFWPSPDAARYADLLRRTTRAIKRKDRSATVLLGGLAAISPSWSPGSIDPRDFLDRVCETGACRRIDGVAYHPYTYPYLASDRTSFATGWEKIARTDWSLRSVLREQGLGHLPIWATEYGAPTGGPGRATDGRPGTIDATTTHVTEGRQAEMAGDAVRTAARSGEVAALFWYSHVDTPWWASGREAYFGLRRADLSAKPAWQAFRDAVAAVRPPA